MKMLEEKIENILRQLSLDEKISLLTGKNFWVTMPFPELGVTSMEVADGPYGLRKQAGISDHMGWNKSEPSIAYVSGPGVASSWDKALVGKLGEHLAVEAKAHGVDVLLGPAINIVRTPLCGRNFEYYSEDPCLTGKMAAAYIDGVQSQGVGTCIKHFAANNQEVDREYINAEIDERTLREIYLCAFEEPIKKAKPTAVMSALNKVNGSYCSESQYLLRQILREEWGYEGFVMSDWSGVNDRARALKAGLDLEMPNSHGVGTERIHAGLKSGTITREDVDASCARLLKAILEAQDRRIKETVWDESTHHAFARDLARQCMVLLKNEDVILPLSKTARVVMLGEFTQNPRFQMEGSALVNPTRYDIPYDEMVKKAPGRVYYGRGCSKDPEEQEKLLCEACALAAQADVAVLMVGLPEGIEAEGRDRKNIHMPEHHIRLVEEVSKVQPNTVVVISGGSPIDMPWLDKVKGVMECFLAGQAMGGALADLLYGEYSPCAKLPVTFPRELRNNPSYFNYPGFAGTVKYHEGVFVGYRYYDTKGMEPLFPFGHGLSYTKFRYSDLRLSAGHITDAERLAVSCTVENIGSMAGGEIVQLYVKPPKSPVLRPEKELREFSKVFLSPGESTEISFVLDSRAFSYYDVELADWYAPGGQYEIAVGASSRDLRLCRKVEVQPLRPKRKEITGWSTIGDLRETDAGMQVLADIRQLIRDCGRKELLNMPLFDESPENIERVDGLPLRMVTLLSDNIINNDIMDNLILRCNQIIG